MTVRELGQRMNSAELAEWMALYVLRAQEERQRELARDASGKLDARLRERHDMEG